MKRLLRANFGMCLSASLCSSFPLGALCSVFALPKKRELKRRERSLAHTGSSILVPAPPFYTDVEQAGREIWSAHHTQYGACMVEEPA